MLGFFALVLAVGAAGWLLWRSARGGGEGGDARTVAVMKGVVFLGLTAALLAAKLLPLALMTLIAAGVVTAIDIYRARAVKIDEALRPQPPKTVLAPEEAASILGVSLDADAEAIRVAHKRLISQLHPDKGGTDYLAAKINDARDVLLSRLS